MAKALTHTHQIRVETDEENVTVSIGGDGGVPGGFAKFFNRVIDSLAWARLPEAAKSAYIVLVRFADHRNHFRVQLGQATLMKYAGLSRSSAKRAVKDLLTSKLLVLVEQGGVTPDGQNECNLYQLMVPADHRPKVGGAAAQRGHGLISNPPGVRERTPSLSPAEPPVHPLPDPDPVRPRTPPGVPTNAPGGSAAGPQLRRLSKESREDSSREQGARSDDDLSPAPSDHQPARSDAAALLEEKGVERTVARQLALEYPHERIVDVVATMEYRKARGKCDNPGGFIRDALVRQWETPRAVIEARRRAEAKLRAEAADRAAREQRLHEGARAGDDERRVEQVIARLDDEELEILAESVLKKYDGNAAVLQVLTRKPPRACRLMKMEIAALLEGAGARR